jgi:hypothetical protein
MGVTRPSPALHKLLCFIEERSAAVLNVLRRSAQGIASPEKAATSKYEAKTLKKGAC